MKLLQGKDLDQNIQACLQKVSSRIWEKAACSMKEAYREFINKQAEESRAGMVYDYFGEDL